MHGYCLCSSQLCVAAQDLTAIFDAILGQCLGLTIISLKRDGLWQSAEVGLLVCISKAHRRTSARSVAVSRAGYLLTLPISWFGLEQTNRHRRRPIFTATLSADSDADSDADLGRGLEGTSFTSAPALAATTISAGFQWSSGAARFKVCSGVLSVTASNPHAKLDWVERYRLKGNTRRLAGGLCSGGVKVRRVVDPGPKHWDLASTCLDPLGTP
jgi:hypothetical protein